MFELPSLPQEMGQIVIEGLRLGRFAYRRLLNLSTVIAFLGIVPTMVELWGKGDDVSFDTPLPTDWASLLAMLRGYDSTYGVTLLVVGSLVLLPQTMLLRRIAFAVLGQKESLWEEARQALRLWPWVLLTEASYVIATGIGCLLLLVPGIILAISLMFSVYATVLDGHKPLAALNASHNLVWGHWWRTAGLWLMINVPLFLLSWMLASALGLELDPKQAVHARDIFKQVVLDMVLLAFLLPFIFSILYLYYRDLKLRKQAA